MAHFDDATPTPWARDEYSEELVRAAALLDEAEVLIIGAGAGLGVDAGLPDFRSERGLWKAYPLARSLGLNFEELSTGAWFERDPARAWAFHAHLARLFDRASPHEGYAILKRWVDELGEGWVYTSNIDRHFYRAGFDPAKITEIHGFSKTLQCARPCGRHTWREDVSLYELDEATLTLRAPLPRCPECGELARPNMLLFEDQRWIGDLTRAQENRLTDWLQIQQHKRVAVIELGAGTTVPNVRFQCERYARAFGTSLIRINPAEPQGPPHVIGIALPAARALRAIDALRSKNNANH